MHHLNFKRDGESGMNMPINMSGGLRRRTTNAECRDIEAERSGLSEKEAVTKVQAPMIESQVWSIDFLLVLQTGFVDEGYLTLSEPAMIQKLVQLPRSIPINIISNLNYSLY